MISWKSLTGLSNLEEGPQHPSTNPHAYACLALEPGTTKKLKTSETYQNAHAALKPTTTRDADNTEDKHDIIDNQQTHPVFKTPDVTTVSPGP